MHGMIVQYAMIEFWISPELEWRRKIENKYVPYAASNTNPETTAQRLREEIT